MITIATKDPMKAGMNLETILSIVSSCASWASWRQLRTLNRAFVAMTLSLSVAVGPARAEIIDRILAVVGGDLITLTDVTAALRFGFVDVAAGTQDPIRAAIDQLIDRRLQLTEVNRYLPPEPSATEIDQQLAAIRGRFESQAAFDTALAEGGLTVEQLSARVRETLRIASYRTQRFAVALQPSEADLVQYYRAHESEFAVGGVVRPFPEVREDVRRRVLAERTEAMIRGWTEGLRRRTEVTILYAPSAPGR